MKTRIPANGSRACPHRFSGGMQQQVAIALLNRSNLIMADEPTTALEVTIREQILYEARKLCRETGAPMIWITHDLAMVAGIGNRIRTVSCHTGPISARVGRSPGSGHSSPPHVTGFHPLDDSSACGTSATPDPMTVAAAGRPHRSTEYRSRCHRVARQSGAGCVVSSTLHFTGRLSPRKPLRRTSAAAPIAVTGHSAPPDVDQE